MDVLVKCFDSITRREICECPLKGLNPPPPGRVWCAEIRVALLPLHFTTSEGRVCVTGRDVSP